ncbi:MAG: sulfatase [Planctomycetota bacterium]|nr:sulfatase [Planctomycetota bacterium]
MPSLLILLALLVALPMGCGEAPSTASTTKRSVLARDLDWHRHSEESASLSLTWSGENGLAAWTSPDPAANTHWVDGGLQLSLAPPRVETDNTPIAQLDGPTETPFDPVVHHWLILHGRTTSDISMEVQWRSLGEDFTAERSSAVMTLSPSSETQSWALPLKTLRAAREAADVSEGLDQFRLNFRSLDTESPADIKLESIVISSDYDVTDNGSLPQHRIGLNGVLRDGVALHAPGTMEAQIPQGSHDLLRLSLGVAGCSSPIEVSIRDAEDQLSRTTVTCTPGEEWMDLALDLSPLEGEPTTLIIEALNAPTPYTTLLVGSVMLMGPDDTNLPDVVFYVEDTLRADHLTTYGHNITTDPHLKRMSQDGAVFEQTFAASSWTRPSVSSLHTSLNPIAHGNLTFGDRVAGSVDTLAESLAEAGYLTASFVTNYHGGGWSGLDQGFDEAHEPTAHGTTRVTTTLTSAAIADPIDIFLNEHTNERVFVFVQSLDPHTPYEPLGEDHYALLRKSPQSSKSSYERERADLALRYDAEILHNDRYLERLDATLAATDRSENTLFLFTSDHGEAFGEHGNLEHRKSLYQEELHIPWLVRWPGVIPSNQRLTEWTGHIDMAPTVLGLLQLEAPTSWQGRDLSTLLSSQQSSQIAPDLDRPLFAHMVHEDEVAQTIAVIRKPYKLIMPLDEAGLPSQPLRLLDLDIDPAERQDIDLNNPDQSAEQAAAKALEQWARHTLEESRASLVREEAGAMTPAMRDWMREMGYLK